VLSRTGLHGLGLFLGVAIAGMENDRDAGHAALRYWLDIEQLRLTSAD
jgi:hypothetical protein